MTFSLDTATLPQMKAFATVNNILITGDKRLKENWAGAIVPLVCDGAWCNANDAAT